MPTPTTDSSRSDDEKWVRTRELAEREGISRATLWRWTKDVKGKIVEVQRRGPRTGVRVRLNPHREESEP